MSAQKTQEQERAAAAWAYVESVKKKDYAGKYGAWARKFPSLVLTNGLGHALSFLRAKSNQAHQRELYHHFSSWVTERLYGLCPGDDSLLERLIGAVQGCDSNSTIYRRATVEALALAGWVKRFAEAELKIEEGDD